MSLRERLSDVAIKLRKRSLIERENVVETEIDSRNRKKLMRLIPRNTCRRCDRQIK